MINEYVNKLIENLPDEIKKRDKPESIDLILDGGLFNGSYLVGALYFLKEMEKRKYIKIERISGCSIGSVVAFLYYIDALDEMPKLYDLVNNEFKNSYKLNTIKELKKHLIERIPEDICKKVNGNLFISYYNIKKGTKKVKSVYKNIDDIIHTIIRSSFVPYLIDGNILYENKYMDGINPFIFKERDKKILFLDLFGNDKLGCLINVRNEKTNYHRILSGLLDIHTFFIKQSKTPMCSYVNEWTLSNQCFNYIKIIIEKFCVYLIKLVILLKNKIPDEFREMVIYKILSKLTSDIFIIILESYCL